MTNKELAQQWLNQIKNGETAVHTDEFNGKYLNRGEMERILSQKAEEKNEDSADLYGAETSEPINVMEAYREFKKLINAERAALPRIEDEEK